MHAGEVFFEWRIVEGSYQECSFVGILLVTNSGKRSQFQTEILGDGVVHCHLESHEKLPQTPAKA